MAAAEKLGFPVALKAVSADILHKTDAGAVMLNIANRAALAASIPTMKNMIAARAPGAVIRFFLLEKMMPAGLELLIGGLRDEQFGPAVAFGLGGVWVQALQDAVFGILPMTRQEQLDMIAETKAGAFMKGFRGSRAARSGGSALGDQRRLFPPDQPPRDRRDRPEPGPAVREGRGGAGYEDRAAAIGYPLLPSPLEGERLG